MRATLAGPILPGLLLVALLAAQPVAAVAERDAPDLRPDVVAVGHSPAVVQPGTQWTGGITFRDGHNVTEARYQICRIGGVCFAPPTLANRTGANEWRFDTTDYRTALGPVTYEAGWELGYQWFLTEATGNGTRKVPFPNGVNVTTPECQAAYVECISTHYFTFRVAGETAAQGPAWLGSWWLPVGLLLAGAALGVAWKALGRSTPPPRATRAVFWLAVAAVLGGTAAGALAVRDSLYDVRPAPPFELTSTGFENGTQGEPVAFSLQDYAGKTVVLDMMAVTCTSCRAVANKVLKPLHEEFGGRDDFAILSIDTWADAAVGGLGETNEELVRLQREDGYAWRHALDTDEVYRKYTAVQLPKILVVDGSGSIVYEKQGSSSLAEVRSVVEKSLQGEAKQVAALRVGIYGMAFVAGLASFFSPCSVGLIPAYLGLCLQDDAKMVVTGRKAVRRALGAGGLTAAGIVTMYAGIAVLLWMLGPFLRPYLPYLGPVVAVALVLLGALMLAGFDWSRVGRSLGAGRVDGRKGFFAFGIGYGLAAFGCTGPAFLPILLAGFAAGPGPGLAVFGLYAGSIAVLVVLAAVLLATGQNGPLRSVLAHTRTISRVAAGLMVLAGAYLFYYYGSALWGW